MSISCTNSYIQPFLHAGPLTNQRILNSQNAQFVYGLLSGPAYQDVTCLTLRPIEYRPPGGREPVLFTGAGARESFVAEVSAWVTREDVDPGRVPMEVHRFLDDVIWEPVDGQHILWACQEIAREEHGAGNLSSEVYGRFLHRPATVLVYDDPRFYVSESRRANIHRFARQRYSTVAENLLKMRELWEFFGCPSTAPQDAARRATYLASVSQVVHSATVPSSGSVKVTTLAKAFRDYLPHVQHASPRDWEAILKVATDYDSAATHYSPQHATKWRAYCAKVTDNPTTKRPKRPPMSIVWLRPFITLETPDFRLLCSLASIPNGQERQKAWFGGSSKRGPKPRTVSDKADATRKRYAVRNALRWLEVRANPTAISWVAFLCFPIGEPLVDNETVKFFAGIVGDEFVRRWAIPIERSVAKMAQREHLIPACILAHHAAKLRGQAGYIGGHWVSENATTWRWEQDVIKFSTSNGEAEVCRYEGDGDIWTNSSVRIGQGALWMFDCRRSGSAGPRLEWSDEDYGRAVMQMRSWMRDVPRYNAVFMLPPSRRYEDVVRHLALPENAMAERGTWKFRGHRQEKGRIVMHAGRPVGSFLPIADIVIVCFMPTDASPLENFVCAQGGFECETSFHENTIKLWDPPACDIGARSPIPIMHMWDYYLPSDWALIVQGLTATVASFNRHPGRRVVVLESDPDREAYIRDQLRARESGEEQRASGRPREAGGDIAQEVTRVSMGEGPNIGEGAVGDDLGQRGELEEVQEEDLEAERTCDGEVEGLDDDEAEEGEEESGSGDGEDEGDGDDTMDEGDESDEGGEEDEAHEGQIGSGGGSMDNSALDRDVRDTGTSPNGKHRRAKRTPSIHTRLNMVKQSLLKPPSAPVKKRRLMFVEDSDAQDVSITPETRPPPLPEPSLSIGDLHLSRPTLATLATGPLLVPQISPTSGEASTSEHFSTTTTRPILVSRVDTTVCSEAGVSRVSVMEAPAFFLKLGVGTDSAPPESMNRNTEDYTLGSDGFFRDSLQVRYRQVVNNNGEVRYEEISFVEAENILSAMEVEAQTTAIVDKLADRYLGPLVEGTNPIERHRVAIVDDVDDSIPETQPEDIDS